MHARRSHRDWARPVFECLSVFSAEAGHGARGSGHGRPWCVISLLEGGCHEPWADTPQTAEQLYQKNSHTVKKVLGPTTDFPTWDLAKGLRPPQGIWLWRQVGIGSQNLHGTGETDSWRAQTKSCVYQDPGEMTSDSTRDWLRLACECPGVSTGGVSWRWPAAGLGALSVAVGAQDL